MPRLNTTKWVLSLMTILSIAQLCAQTPCIRIVYVDAPNDIITLRSFEEDTLDISGYSFCSSLACDSLASLLINFGSLNIAPGDSVQFVHDINGNTADVGLYINTNNYTDPDLMVDFMQYESSISLFNHATADEKGIWESGTFIDTAAPYIYYGNGCEDNGVEFWSDPNGLSSRELENRLSFLISPQSIEVTMTDLRFAQIELFDVNGRQLFNVVNYEPTRRIETNALPTGMYFLQVLVDRAVVTKKVVLTSN